jgi:hypothetical protein
MRNNRERAYYRVEYPIQERPELTLDLAPDKGMAVFDISESGIRFAPRDDVDLSVGDEVTASLTFRGRSTVEVEGEVVWVQRRSAGLRLSKVIPFGTILDEQRYLKSRYRNLLD